MLWPTINPDGQQMVAEWYEKRRHMRAVRAPVLYQDYVRHDNSRDMHAEHDRVTRHGTGVETVGAARSSTSIINRGRFRHASGSAVLGPVGADAPWRCRAK
jgi:hypothetical protein